MKKKYKIKNVSEERRKRYQKRKRAKGKNMKKYIALDHVLYIFKKERKKQEDEITKTCT